MQLLNNEDPDETLYSVASHLGLYCLLRPVCPILMLNTVFVKSADPESSQDLH